MLEQVPVGEPLRARELPVGPPPRVEYAFGTTIVRPDGRRITLEIPPTMGGIPSHVYGFATLRSGWITSAERGDGMGPAVQRHARDGSMADATVSGLFVVDASPDGRHVLVQDLGSTVLVSADGSTRRIRGQQAQFLRDLVVVHRRDGTYLGAPGGDLRRIGSVLVRDTAASSRSLAVGSAGRHHGVFSLLPRVAQVLAVDDASQAGADVDLRQISPRGTYVLGTREGPGPDVLFLAHVTTGDVVAIATGLTWRGDDQAASWETESRVLVPAATRRDRDVHGSSTHLLRLRADGRVERAPTSPPRFAILPVG